MSPRRRWPAPLSGFLVTLPVVVAVARAVAGDWLPVGDNALIAIRAHDVFTAHPPLLGTWTSASVSTGTVVHNPGPLLFDVLALPLRLFGGPGVALAVGVVNLLAAVGIVVVAARRGGPLAAVAAGLATAALSWVMGSELLVEPWQPHTLLLPFLLFLLLVWTVSAGDLPAVPWMAGVGSYVLQTHVSYVLLVPVLAIWAVVALVVGRRGATPGAEPVAASGTGVRRTTWVTAAVLALCWSQPVIQQLAKGGDGNLSRLATRSGQTESVGATLGAQLVASVVTTPPWWSRSSFADAWVTAPGDYRPGAADLPSAPVAVVTLTVLVAVLALGAYRSGRSGDRPVAMAAAGSLVGVVAGVATAAVVPLGVFGLSPHQFRWLWPLSAFVGFTLLVMLARSLPRGRLAIRAFTVAGLGLTMLLTVLNLPAGPTSPSTLPGSVEMARTLTRRLAVTPADGPVLVRLPPVFGDPYGAPVMAELQRREVSFLVVPEWTPQVGDQRRFSGDNARSVLTFAGPRSSPPPGGRVVAAVGDLVLFLTPVERRR